MQKQQNQESFHCYAQNYGGLPDDDGMDELQSPLFRQNLQQSANCFEAAEKNSGFSNPIDLLGAESFHTEHRGSLKIVPYAAQHDFGCKPDEDMASTLKSSQTSLIFEDQDDDEDRQRKLIIKTEALTLRSSESLIPEEFTHYSPKKNRSPAKNHKQKVQPIRQPKQLIRELKRQYKYNHKILGDITLEMEDIIATIKSGVIEPIVSEKGQLSGIIIRDGEMEYKIKVTSKGAHFDPQLQLWNENQEIWKEFTFKIKILSI